MMYFLPTDLRSCICVPVLPVVSAIAANAPSVAHDPGLKSLTVPFGVFGMLLLLPWTWQHLRNRNFWIVASAGLYVVFLASKLLLDLGDVGHIWIYPVAMVQFVWMVISLKLCFTGGFFNRKNTFVRGVFSPLSGILGAWFPCVHRWICRLAGVSYLAWVFSSGWLFLTDTKVVNSWTYPYLLYVTSLLYGAFAVFGSGAFLTVITYNATCSNKITVRDARGLMLRGPILIALFNFSGGYVASKFVLEVKPYWLLGVLVVAGWISACVLWYYYLLRVADRAQNSDYLDKIEELRAQVCPVRPVRR